MTEKESLSTNIIKWLAGILSAVLIAVFTWWLTHPGGTLNPSKVDIKILSVEVPSTKFEQKTQAKIRVYNEGDLAAQRCRVFLSFDKSNTIFERFGSSSTEFGLMPKETINVSLESFIGNTQTGSRDLSFDVKCDNARSPVFKHYVWVDR